MARCPGRTGQPGQRRSVDDSTRRLPPASYAAIDTLDRAVGGGAMRQWAITARSRVGEGSCSQCLGGWPHSLMTLSKWFGRLKLPPIPLRSARERSPVDSVLDTNAQSPIVGRLLGPPRSPKTIPCSPTRPRAPEDHTLLAHKTTGITRRGRLARRHMLWRALLVSRFGSTKIVLCLVRPLRPFGSIRAYSSTSGLTSASTRIEAREMQPSRRR